MFWYRNPSKIIEALQDSIRQFRGADYPVVVTSEKLSQYLAQTEFTDFERSLRLVALASGLQSELDWKGFCRIYEEAVSCETVKTQGVSLVPWCTGALEWWIRQESGLDVETRLAVAHELIGYLDQQLKEHPQNSALAHMFGLVYFRHPNLPEHEAEYLTKALDWFEKSAKWALEHGEEVEPSTQLHIAHCCLGLGSFDRAMGMYEDIAEQSYRQLPESDIENLRQNLAICQSKTAEGTGAVNPIGD